MNTPDHSLEISVESTIARGLELARDASFRAGNLVLELREKGLPESEQKSEHKFDVLTIADRQSEDLIVAAIREAFPGHGIEGEEGTTEHLESPWLWSIDAIDGTFNFSHGSPDFGISIGLLHNGVPVAGAIYFPVKKELLSAAKGQGAFVNDRPIKVAEARDLAHSIVGLDFGYADRAGQIEKVFTPVALKAGYPRVQANYVGGTMAVAQGHADAYVHSAARLYDMAAAIIITREAGGVVTGMYGELNLQNKFIDAIFASNEALRQELQALLIEAAGK